MANRTSGKWDGHPFPRSRLFGPMPVGYQSKQVTRSSPVWHHRQGPYEFTPYKVNLAVIPTADLRMDRSLINSLGTLDHRAAQMFLSAEYLSDRIGIMSEGELMATGTAAELMAKTHAAKLEDAFLALAEPGGTQI